MATQTLKISSEQCDALVVFLESRKGQDVLERLQSSNKALMILSDLDAMMGTENNLYITGDGLVSGRINVFVSNVQQPPMVKPVMDLKEFVGRSGYSCRIPDHCLGDVVGWICEAAESSAEEVRGVTTSIK